MVKVKFYGNEKKQTFPFAYFIKNIDKILKTDCPCNLFKSEINGEAGAYLIFLNEERFVLSEEETKNLFQLSLKAEQFKVLKENHKENFLLGEEFYSYRGAAFKPLKEAVKRIKVPLKRDGKVLVLKYEDVCFYMDEKNPKDIMACNMNGDVFCTGWHAASYLMGTVKGIYNTEKTGEYGRLSLIKIVEQQLKEE